MAENVKDLTDATFKAAVSQGVTLVDFWATWCPPCKMQGPIVEKLAGDFAGKALIAKVNVDEEGETATAYRVSSIPTLVLMKDGREMERLVGLQQEAALVQALNKLL